MKGVVFTEFLDMVEEKFGYEVVDQIIRQSDLASNGVYTSVGTYPHTEIIQLVTKLSEIKEIPIPDLLKEYASHLGSYFIHNYDHFFSKAENAFDFLKSIDNYIHVEVKKLYPDAELPKFETTLVDENTLEMLYISERKMSDLAHGLILKSIQYFKEDISVEKKIIEADGSKVLFTVKK